MEGSMREAAAEQAYERATAIKKRIEQAHAIEHKAFRHVRPIGPFNYLIVQRGGGTTRLKPFFVRGGVITSGQEMKRPQLADSIPLWIQKMHEQPPTLQREERSEHVWLVSHFLFKPEPPGCFLQASQLCEVASVLPTICDRFSRESAAKPDRDETIV